MEKLSSFETAWMGLCTFENHEKSDIRKLPLKTVMNPSFIESRYLKLAEKL